MAPMSGMITREIAKKKLGEMPWPVAIVYMLQHRGTLFPYPRLRKTPNRRRNKLAAASRRRNWS